MINSVQRLLYPRHKDKPHDKASIFMPKELAYLLDKVFMFDVSGGHELAGDQIYRAMRTFTKSMRDREMCAISFDVTEIRMQDPMPLCALAPIAHAPEVIDFIADQVGPEICDLAVPTGMKNSFEEDSDILGWFDLDTPSFIFRNMRPAMVMCQMAGITLADLPQIDRDLHYAPSAGEWQKDAIPKMGILARAWGSAIKTRWNEEDIVVTPAGEVILAPIPS